MSKVIKGDKILINNSAENIFNFIGDFNHFESLLPEEVSNWQSSADTCSFEVKGLVALGLRIIEKTPFTKVLMKGEGKLPFDFTFEANIEPLAPAQTEVQLLMDTQMNMFTAMVAERPLTHFVETLGKKLKELMETEAPLA